MSQEALNGFARDADSNGLGLEGTVHAKEALEMFVGLPAAGELEALGGPADAVDVVEGIDLEFVLFGGASDNVPAALELLEAVGHQEIVKS